MSRRAPSTRATGRATRLGFERCEPRHLLVADTGHMAVGMNLENVVDWSPAWTFTDAFKASRPWISQAFDTRTGATSWDAAAAPALDLDANGNVRSLQTWTQGGTTMRQFAGTLMFRGLGGGYAGGSYRAEWDGTGTVTFDFDAVVTASGRTNAGRNFADLRVTPTYAGIFMRIEATDPADPVRDFNVWMPDWNGQRFAGLRWQPGAAFSPFHPLFLQRLAPFKTLRFMGMQETNTSDIVTWAQRRDAADARQGSGPEGTPSEPVVNGISLEYMVQLANDLDADSWFNMPHLADDTFVQNFATYVRDHLEPGRKVYVEWANEVWNFAPGFEASQWVVRQARAESLDQDLGPWIVAGREAKRDFDIWSSVFDGQTGRLVRVAAGQAANVWIVEQIAAAMGGAFDAIALAPYITPTDAQRASYTSTTTVDRVIGDTRANVATSLEWTRDHAALAARLSTQTGRPIRLLAYEGGPHLDGRDAPYQDAFHAATNDPRMGDIYREYLTGLDSAGLQLYVDFQFTGQAGAAAWGDFAKLHRMDEPLSTAWRYAAVAAAADGSLWNGPAQPPAGDGPQPRTSTARFVVPLGVPADGVTNFHGLRQALQTPGLAAGAVIQIEPGSTPGTLSAADLPAVAGLKIQGNQGVPVAEIPQITVVDTIDVQTPGVAFTLSNLQLNFVQAGELKLGANATIENSVLLGNRASGERLLTLDGATMVVIRDCVIVHNAGAAEGGRPGVVLVQPAAAATAIIAGNTFVSNVSGGSSLRYVGNSAGGKIFGNTFTDTKLFVADGVGGLSVTDNEFRGVGQSNGVAVELEAGAAGDTLTILRNTIAGVGQGIVINGGGTTSVTIAGNRIGTRSPGQARPSWGWGIRLFTGGGTLNATVEANDLRDNRIGVEIAGSGSAAAIDLGGGARGSRGGNNFRSFTDTAGPVSNTGAISVTAAAAAGPVSARGNLFTAADPESVIYDAGDDATLADVRAGNALTGNAAYVQALYLCILERPGNVGNAGDAAAWVTMLDNGGSRSVVAESILRSAEGLGLQVASLYRTVLGREVEDAGRQAWVGYLQRGGTAEQLTSLLVASAEYRNRSAGSDVVFVHSLYARFFNRAPDGAGLAFWTGQVPTLGRAEVARRFLGSTEFRDRAVRGFYLNVLRRPATPSAGEVAAWVGSGIDSLGMLSRFVSSNEFAHNG
jgi:hypothetical protein